VITVTINDNTVEYHCYETSAPEDYDGFGTIHLCNIDASCRYVLIRGEYLDWQVMRYESGMATAKAIPDFESNVEDELWLRLGKHSD
jgi:hypothetical protein